MKNNETIEEIFSQHINETNLNVSSDVEILEKCIMDEKINGRDMGLYINNILMLIKKSENELNSWKKLLSVVAEKHNE